MLLLLSLPCGWGDHDPRGPGPQRFHVLHSIPEDLGPLCYTGSPVSSRRATLRTRTRLRAILAPALNSLVWLVPRHDAYKRSVRLTMSSDSSSAPGLRLPGLTTLPGRLHTSGSSGHSATARQTHASVEYLRRHAGLGQDRSSQAVSNATSCREVWLARSPPTNGLSCTSDGSWDDSEAAGGLCQ